MKRRVTTTLATLALLAVARGGAAVVDTAALTEPMRAALEPAVAELITRYNQEQAKRRDTPHVQTSGPDADPYLARATYRRAEPGHQLVAIDSGSGGPVLTVRVRTVELEKRVTNLNGGDLHRALAAAPWLETPRGYLLDFRLRWDGAAWLEQGSPVERPILGVVGGPVVRELLESNRLLHRTR